MAKITLTPPTNLSAVKSTYSGGNNIRDYLAGANTVSANEVGYNGFIPSSGTIDLTKFRGATSVSVPSTVYSHGTNTTYSSMPAYPDSPAFSCIELSNTGILRYSTDDFGTSDPGQFFNITSPDNRWLVRTASDSEAKVTNNFEFQYVPTSGNASGDDWAIAEDVRTTIFAGSVAGTPNTWYTGNVIFSLFSNAGIPNTTVEKTSNGTITIRRTDTQATVATFTAGFHSRSRTIDGVPP